MRDELGVWLFADRIGTLAMQAGRLGFTYAPDWLARPDASALSTSLPLRAEAYDDHGARPFFAGLLPEGRLRQLLARQLGISRQNDFALLELIGGECAGAVSLLPEGHAPNRSGKADEVRWLDDEEVLRILAELPLRPMLAGDDGLRLSLAGAQDKLPVVFDGTRIGLPLLGTPSSHILKPAIRGIDDSVTNEAFCLAVARAARLGAVDANVRSVSGTAFLMVERYDRFPDAQGRRQRIHQEDFCQALGVVPEAKYQNEGGPDLAQSFDLVRRVTRPSAPQVLRLLDCTLFNALIGNHDAHAKNFSLLYTGGSCVLAPCYDLLCTAVYPSLTPKMAMKIGGRYKFSEVQSRHWMQFAEQAGLAKAQMRRRALEFAGSLPSIAREVQAGPDRSFAGNALVERIVDVIERRCALTMKRLSAAGEMV